MNPRERVWAALRGDVVDRPPISFWGHSYHRESSAEDLVSATLEFHARYGWDWVKLNPRKHYHVEPWGVSYHYPGVPDEKPVLDRWPIRDGDDWAKIGEVAHDAGALGEQLEAVRLLRSQLPASVPMIQTVFTPFAILGEMTREPKDLVRHLDTHEALVRKALEAVTAVFERHVRAVIAAGAEGIYLATVDWASRDLMSPERYRDWARPGDLRLLEATGQAPFNVLHVCRRNNLLPELADYPVAAFSWAAGEPGNLSLGEGLARVRGAVMGGIAHEGALLRDDLEAISAELRRAFEDTGGRRWLAAPSCSIPPTTRPGQLRRLRAEVERLSPLRTAS
jgi:uroporphyrinogen decarboxylase